MPVASAQPHPAPWSFFTRHRDRPFPFFLDRGIGTAPSFAGSWPREQLLVERSGDVHARSDGGAWRRIVGDPLACIASFVDRSREDVDRVPDWLARSALPRCVGYLAWELGFFADGALAPLRAPRPSRRGTGTPLALLSVYDEVDAWDPRTGRRACLRWRSAAKTSAVAPAPLPEPEARWIATTRDEYLDGFRVVREAIAAGDIYQANLSRRALFRSDADAASTYARLRELQPVPWGAFLDFGGFALLSNSPECFLVRDGARLRTQPIKGTRPRGDNAELDERRAAELRGDAKEMAEHLMIVDLERNDLGRVAETGSVRVERFAEVESFATLHHLVSDVCCELHDDVGLEALLRATFPGGSISGAPKIRATRILDEVERAERGPYTGAIGHFDGSARFELSIAIRTAVARRGELLYSTGGGLVADSDPEREWKETELKIAALDQALRASPQAGAVPIEEDVAGAGRRGR